MRAATGMPWAIRATIALALVAAVSLLWFSLARSAPSSPRSSAASSSTVTATTAPGGGTRHSSAPPSAGPVPATEAATRPLEGKLIVLDPGHQLGNAKHTREIGRLVPAGNGMKKACNTTGTSTAAGYPEATFTFNVAVDLKAQLEELGATVEMTRSANDAALWGPCIDARGSMGNAEHAAAKISIHGDGAGAGNRGFHVIVSTTNGAWREQSTALAHEAVSSLEAAGFSRSSYIGGGTGLSLRSDLGTNNLSEMPTIMVELGNMRNASDAALMASADGQHRYASALAQALVEYLAT